MKRTISVEMGKGSVNHNSRKFKAQNVDGSRTHLNIDYCNERIQTVYHQLFDDALKRYNEKQTRSDRRIPNYYEKIRSGNQEKPFHEIILQVGNQDDMNATADLDMTFASFVEQYTADMKTRIKENTWATKDHIIRTKLLPYFGKLKMCNITAQQIITWQNEMLNHKDENGEKYSLVYVITPMRRIGLLDEENLKGTASLCRAFAAAFDAGEFGRAGEYPAAGGHGVAGCALCDRRPLRYDEKRRP